MKYGYDADLLGQNAVQETIREPSNNPPTNVLEDAWMPLWAGSNPVENLLNALQEVFSEADTLFLSYQSYASSNSRRAGRRKTTRRLIA
jgi:hypothetical protein